MDFLPKNHLLKYHTDTLETIRKLYNLEDQKNLAGAIDVLETWMKQQNHFLKKDYDRTYLERTLISCKGSIEKTKSRIDNLCTMKTLLPNFFTECNVKDDFKYLLEIVSVAPLPVQTRDHYRILMSKASSKPIQAGDIVNFYRFNIIISEYMKAYDYSNGFIIIHDFRDVNILDLLNKTNFVELQQFMRILVEGYGARLQAIHVFNDSKVMEIFVKTLKQLISAKLGDRIFVHSSHEQIHNLIPKELLPHDYGGEQKPIAEICREWVEELSSENFSEYLKMVFAARTDETYRQTDKFNEEYMGMPGSFRTLNVD